VSGFRVWIPLDSLDSPGCLDSLSGCLDSLSGCLDSGVWIPLGEILGVWILIRTGVEIESRVALSALAAAVRFTALAVSQNQIAPKKGLVGQELSSARACVSFLDRVLGS
jgi:hypothetical protein